jgi:serine/threonine protein kinase
VELRTREAARLLTEVSPLLETGDLASAEAAVGKALELDPSNQQARELWRRVEHLSQSSILFKARPTLETAGPAAPEQSAVVYEESFTRMFSTVPVRPEPRAKSSVPLPPIEAVPANVTSVFALPEPVGRAGQPFTKHDQPPTDTVLTISNCADPAFLGTKVGLQRFPFTIGRSDGADWKLLFDDAVSANHAEIAFREDGFFVRDLGSSNGTFLNGQRLHPMREEVLLFGARVTLGSNTELVFGAGALQEIPDVKGKLIGNRFTLREKIYSSSKSVLYLARDENLNRDVAVKLLSPSLIRYAGYREQFSREAQTASLLRHPNICQVIDYGEVCLEERTGSRSLYVCREYLTGGSLRSRLNQGEALPLDRIASWLDTLCSALDYVHGRGMIHAGIKPSAIVFDAEGVPYLTDFSLATKSGDGARHAVIGAPAFLAPEQWEGADPVPATDQYSLAVLFYGLIAGALPFEGQEHYVVRKRNLQRGPVPVHEMAAQSRRPPVPLAVSAVLQKALAVQASDRFPGARDFATAFRSALVEPVTPRISPPSVFISYHRATSSAWALLLKREMERDHGFQVFVDAEQQDSTGQFPVKLQRRINQCDVFVCLLAESTLASDWVKREIEFASQIGKPMIPVFQESYRDPPNLCAVEPHIQELLTFEGVKLLDRQNIYFDATMQALIASVRRSMETAEHRSRPLGVTPFASAQSPGEGVARRLMRKVRAFLYSA